MIDGYGVSHAPPFPARRLLMRSPFGFRRLIQLARERVLAAVPLVS